MHERLVSVLSNSFLFIILLGLLILPFWAVTYTKLDSRSSVLSDQDKRPAVQLPRERILRENSEKLDQKRLEYERIVKEAIENSTENSAEEGLSE
ncbi:hypothetical protein JXA34_03960 [Patescibacteria group bacterium]|nr:hypothetical protein [Patescibacteria group bacterium]